MFGDWAVLDPLKQLKSCNEYHMNITVELIPVSIVIKIYRIEIFYNLKLRKGKQLIIHNHNVKYWHYL